MKKAFLSTLALLILLSFAACQGRPAAPTDDPAATKEPAVEAVALPELLEQVYGKMESLEISFAPTTEVELADADAVKAHLGLDSAEGVKEAVFSEPMMSSIAYSVCLVRVEAGADKDALMRAMVDGVDPRKWICVEAESVSAVSSGDVIMLVMTEKTLSDELIASFTAVMDPQAVSAPVVRGK